MIFPAEVYLCCSSSSEEKKKKWGRPRCPCPGGGKKPVSKNQGRKPYKPIGGENEVGKGKKREKLGSYNSACRDGKKGGGCR